MSTPKIEDIIFLNLYEGTHNLRLDDGYGNTDCDLDVQSGGAMLTWLGNGGEEIRQREISVNEMLEILEKSDFTFCGSCERIVTDDDIYAVEMRGGWIQCSKCCRDAL